MPVYNSASGGTVQLARPKEEFDPRTFRHSRCTGSLEGSAVGSVEAGFSKRERLGPPKPSRIV